jgi:threonine aldolase
MRAIDLRSDTVTGPTPEMRRAMYDAELGDDGLEGDPTTRRLQELAAEMMGTEAGLLVASGSMGNLVCALAHCDPGEAMLVGETSHMMWSAGQAATHPTYAQIEVRSVPDGGGMLEHEEIEQSVKAGDEAGRRAGLVCVENSHNLAHGAALVPAYIESVATVAHDWDIPLHIDGARIFNAAVALGLPASDLVGPADSITFCLSKGLACPIGSVVCGSREFIARARNRRKIVGGEMRQTGTISAAGIVALKTMVERLAEDHANARRLAEGLAQIEGIRIEVERVVTNILYFTVKGRPAEEVEKALDEQGVRCFALDGRIRMLTHYHVTPQDIETTLQTAQRVIASKVTAT